MQAPSAPSSGDKVDLKELNGALLYINVRELVKDIDTAHGKSDAVKCDVAVLDGGKKGNTFDDTLIFPKVLVSQLSPAAGTSDPVVVGRLGQGLAKPGKSAPWVLNAPSADDLKTAEKYEAYASSQKAAQEEPF
jgi:hypothetical protein